MGAFCAVERQQQQQQQYEVTREDGRHGDHDNYNSVLVRRGVADASSTSGHYELVYRPPCFNARLTPGESRPRFWVNPSVPPKEAALVSVAWDKSSATSYCHYFTRTKTSKRSFWHRSLINACLGGEDEDTKNSRDTRSEVVELNPTLDSGDNNLNIKTYPDFVLPFVNKVVRLRVVCLDPKMSQLVGCYGHLNQGLPSDPCAEMSHLIRNVHWLRLYLTYCQDVSGLPQVYLEEHHGGIKRFKKIRYRPMSVSWIDMDHRKPAIRISGDSFMLNLEPPPPNLSLEDFPESNGDRPSAVGIYIRSLDTASHGKIQFSVCLFGRYTQSVHEHHLRNGIDLEVSSSTFLE